MLFRKSKNKICLAVLIFASSALLATLMAPDCAKASFNYRVIEGIPGFISKGSSVELNEYISSVYKFGIWTIGIAALFMLSIGAFVYITSAGNNAVMGTAKTIIADAIIGLVLAMLSWLLLNTINPDLLSAPGISSGSSPTDPWTPTTPVAPPSSKYLGFNTQVPAQNSDASEELNDLLNCMNSNRPSGSTITISSISDGNGGVSCYKDHPAWSQCTSSTQTNCCFHKRNSCHYGGTASSCAGKSYAVDFSSRQSSIDNQAIMALATQCGGSTLNEGGHVHVSVGSCGCN